MCLPAVANAVSVAQGGHRLVPYDTYLFQLRVLVMIIFIAAQAPELVSRDLRSHVLPLYFCRPLRRLDYPLAKLIAFILACLALIEIPLLLLYLGTIAQAHGPRRDLGPDQGADPRPARRGAVGGAPGRDRAGAGLADRAAGLRHRVHRDLLLPHLDPRRAARQHRRRRRPRPADRGSRPSRRRGAAVRPGQPVHHGGRGAAVAGRHLARADPAAGRLRAAVRGDVPAAAGGRARHLAARYRKADLS